MGANARKDRISGYLGALDGLRAVSLILIVIFHTWQQSWIFGEIALNANAKLSFVLFQKYGFVAIDAFFVLSGFCLFYPVARGLFGERPFGGWKDFFIKRARRIYPSYLLMLILLLIFPTLSWVTNNLTDPGEIAKHFFSHLFFVHNFSESTQGSMISTAWTMPIEVQFYLLFPLLCIPFRKHPVATFAGMSALSVGLRLTLMCTTNIARMVIQAIPLAYLDVFGAGMLGAYFVVWARNRLRKLRKLRPLMTLITMACIAAAVGYMFWLRNMRMPEGFNGDVYFRFLYRGLFAAILACFLATACFSWDLWQKKIWGNRFFVFLSSISYTFYLWHQNIYIFLKRVKIPYTTADPVMSDRAAMDGMVLICLTASLLISVFVTKYIEGPIVKYGYSGCARRIWTSIQSIGGHKKRPER